MIKQIKTDVPAYREYYVNMDHLNEKERELVEELKEIAKLIGPIFRKQENPNYAGANFYPHDASKKEIEEASLKDPKILNPYTVVKRGKDGLYAVDFAEEFKDDFKAVIQRLKAVQKIVKDLGDDYEDTLTYVKTLIEAFDGKLDFHYVVEEFAKVRGNNVDFLLGPFEPYLDNLFGVKHVIDADVRIKSTGQYYTKEYLDIAWNTIISGGLLAPDNKKIPFEIRVDNVVCYAGSEADFITSGANYPIDQKTIKKTGLKLIIYTTGIKHKLFEKGVDIFHDVFAKSLVNQFSEELLVDGAIRRSLLHEIAESVTKLHYDLSVFKNFALPIQELNADMLSLKVLGIHMLTGASTDEQLRAALLAFILRSITDYKNLSASSHNNAYVIGRSIAIRKMLEEKAIHKPKFRPAKFSIDFYKAYKIVESLSDEVMGIIERGDLVEGERFIKKYANINIFKEFDHLLG